MSHIVTPREAAAGRERGRMNEYTRKPGRIGVFLVARIPALRPDVAGLDVRLPEPRPPRAWPPPPPVPAGFPPVPTPPVRSGLTALPASLRPGRLRGNVASSLFLPARGWAEWPGLNGPGRKDWANEIGRAH